MRKTSSWMRERTKHELHGFPVIYTAVCQVPVWLAVQTMYTMGI